MKSIWIVLVLLLGCSSTTVTTLPPEEELGAVCELVGVTRDSRVAWSSAADGAVSVSCCDGGLMDGAGASSAPLSLQDGASFPDCASLPPDSAFLPPEDAEALPDSEDAASPPDSGVDPPPTCDPGQKFCLFEGCVVPGGDYGCDEACDPCPTVFYGKSICDGDQCSADCDAGFEPAPRLPEGNITCRAKLPDGCTEAWVPDCTGFGSQCPGGIPRPLCSRKADVGTDILWCC